VRIRVSLKAYNQEQADIFICIIAMGYVIPEAARGFYLPGGDMAIDKFDYEVDKAFERLTPGQQAAIMDGRFRIVSNMIEVTPGIWTRRGKETNA
jgi:hypothetical protein